MPGATVVGDRGADRETGEKEAGEEEEVGGYESPQDVLAALLPAGPLTGGEPAGGGGGGRGGGQVGARLLRKVFLRATECWLR